MRFNFFNALPATKAFTLLELLVALTIFAVIAIVAYTGLNTVLTARMQTQIYTDQLAEIQIASLQLRRDMEQCVARTIRDEYGETLPALQASATTIELTHAGWKNPLQKTRSTLQRTRYYLENDKLWRASWQVLDRAQDSQPQITTILSHVDKLNFHFLDNTLKWYDQWIPTHFSADNSDNSKPMLRAIELIVTLKTFGKIRWLYQCQLAP